MKKLFALAAAAVLALSLFAGCSSQKAELALITDIGTIDDKSFNQGSWEGLVKYAEEKGISKKYYKPTEKSNDAYLQSIDLAVKGGAKTIVCPGFLFQEPVQTASATYPDVNFIAIDCVLENPAANAVGISYAEEQVGFLAGYAAVKEGYTNLGFLGGLAVPAVVRYGYGFVQGAEYAANEAGMAEGSISIKYGYTGNFDATPENKSMAASWYNDGTEIIFACGGAVGNSVMAAAEEAGTKVIGVDVDQSSESDTVVISAMKGLGTSVYDTIASIYDSKFQGGQNVTLGAAENGVSLSMESSKLEKFTQKDYQTLYAALAANTNNIASNILNTPAEDGKVSSANIPLSAVVVEEVA